MSATKRTRKAPKPTEEKQQEPTTSGEQDQDQEQAPKEKKEEPTFHFEGFEPSNTTAVPDVFFDVLLPILRESEVRALLYIIRRTLGFKKTTDAISANQFLYGITKADGTQLDSGCGIKDKTTLYKALKSLVEKGCIEQIKTKYENGEYATTRYRVRFKSASQDGTPTDENKKGSSGTTPPQGSGQNPPPVVGRTHHPRARGSGQNPPPVVGVPHQQDTVLQHTDSQKTGKQQTVSQAKLVEVPPVVPTAPARTEKWIGTKPDEPQLLTRDQLEKLSRKRIQEVWALFDKLFNIKVSRSNFFNKKSVEGIVQSGYTDEEITITFKTIEADKYTQLTISNIEEQLPTRVRQYRQQQENPGVTNTTSGRSAEPPRPSGLRNFTGISGRLENTSAQQRKGA